MSRSNLRYFYFALFLLAALPLSAQSGCTDSPENPTAVLGLIGIAGACYAPLKAKLTSFFHSKRDI